MTIVIDDHEIGSWVNSCRSRERRGQLPGWLVTELESIPGWTWRR